MKVWHNGNIQDGDVQISSLNFSLHYAAPTIWEGIRSYLQKDGSTKIFKLREHVVRFLESAKILNFTIPYSEAEIMVACEEVVKVNGGGDLYLRPIAYSAKNAELSHPRNHPIHVDIYARPLTTKERDLKMVISNLVRGYPQFNMQAKTPANYAILQHAEQQVTASQVDDLFLIDNQGYVVEAQIANFFVVKGNYIFTPPNNGSILPGVTRSCVIAMLQNFWMAHTLMPILAEKQVTKADLYTADAVFLCGTFVEIANVSEIDGRKLPGSKYVDLIKKTYVEWTRG